MDTFLLVLVFESSIHLRSKGCLYHFFLFMNKWPTFFVSPLAIL